MADMTLRIQHSKNTITQLSYTQYSVTYAKRKLVIILMAVICLLLGTRLIGSIQSPYHYLFSLYGCFSIVFLNFPAKRRAEKIIIQIERSSCGYPCSIFEWGDKEFSVTSDNEKAVKEYYKYCDCHKLVEYKNAYYYFINRHAAFIFPFDQIIEQKQTLKNLLEKKTNLSFQPLHAWWNISLHSLRHAIKNTR